MDKKIIKCEIHSENEPRQVEVQFEDMEIKKIFRYYSDEISFTPDELIGLTEDEALRLFGRKDRGYLMS